MCLAVPGQIESVYERSGARMGTVNFGGVRKEVCLEYVPEAHASEYVIVHVGFALAQIDECSAEETLRNLKELGLLEEELGPTGLFSTETLTE